MRNVTILLVMTVLAVFLLTGCAAYVISPVTGGFYTDVKIPGLVGCGKEFSKVGTAEMTSILGFVAYGDASIEAAMKASGITKIHHVDYQAFSVLGIYAKFTVMVYGE